MALRLLESFDWSTNTDDYVDKYQQWTGGAIEMPGRTGIGAGASMNARALFAPKSEWYVGMGVKCSHAASSATFIFRWADGMDPQITFEFDTVTGKIHAYRGGNFLGIGKVLIGSTGTPLPLMPFQWYSFQVKTIIHPVAGAVQIYINSLLALDLVGINTQATANPTADQFHFGFGFLAIDDLWICDGDGAAPYNSYLGDLQIVNIRPNGVGDLSAWTPSAGANWQCVDEMPPDGDTTYVSSAVVGNIDTYNMEDVGLVATIRGVQLNVDARKDDAGVRTIRPIYRQAGVNYVGADDTLNTTYKITKMVMQVDPATGVSWVPAAVNSAQFGQEQTA